MSASPVTDALRDCLRAQDLFSPSAVLLAAVSGGSDSMALLSGLSRLQTEAGFRLYACHVQHGLRGAESLEDEALVRRWCAQHGIPLTVHTAQLGGDLHAPGMESRARDLRRAFFSETMQSLAAHALLLAHHQDDQAETVLMHLLRGAGANGLSGMQPCTPFGGGLLLRPFLSLSKEALRAAVSAWQVPYREDASNQTTITLRNALRLQALPLLEQLSPGCTERIAQAALLLHQDEQALRHQADAFLRSHALTPGSGFHALPLSPLRRLEPAVAVRALRRWYREGADYAGLSPQERALCAADSQRLLTLSPGDFLNLPGQLKVTCTGGWLHLTRQDDAPLAPAPVTETPLFPLSSMAEGNLPLSPWSLPAPEGSRQPLSLTLSRAVPEHPPTDALTAYLPPLEHCVLRTPRPGDTIHPLGAPGSKLLRRYLTDRKIDAPFRSCLPVLADGSEILWIPGLCTSQRLVHVPGQACLRLTLNAPPPYLPTPSHKGD